MRVLFSTLIFLVTPNTYFGFKDRWQNTKKNLRGYFTYRFDELWAEPGGESYD